MESYKKERIELKSDEFTLRNLENMYSFAKVLSSPNDNINDNILRQIDNVKDSIKERKYKIKNFRKTLKTLGII